MDLARGQNRMPYWLFTERNLDWIVCDWLFLNPDRRRNRRSGHGARRNRDHFLQKAIAPEIRGR